MTSHELRDSLSEAGALSRGAAKLNDGRTVVGLHPRIVTEVNPDALTAGWDSEYLVMDVPHDPTLIYRIRIGHVDGVAVAPINSQ